MDLQLAKPEAVIKAQERQKGMNWFLEILVFVVVFLVGGIAQILCMLPVEMLLLSRNAMHRAALETGDVEGVSAAAIDIACQL